jgi:xanthine dehydrogenase molybdenum-binding subunit
MTIADVAHRCWAESTKTIAAVESYRPLTGPPAYVAVFVEVEVDTWTGAIRTVRAVSGSDSGTIINPDLASGQLEGGLLQGAGFALYEDAKWDRQGRLYSAGLITDAKIPGIVESPPTGEVATFFADTYEPNGPFGAKGIGEAATNPVAAAYASAVHNALGVRFYSLPITPEKVVQALAGNGSSDEGRPS